MAGAHEANSPLKAGFAGCLSDSCLISPPTFIRLDETPCQYFLRGKGRFASTPLLSWEQSDNESGVNDTVKIDFSKRLDIYENDVNDFYPQLPQETDSGFESLINTTNELSQHETGDSKEPRELHDPSRLGAIPKRRSPRRSRGVGVVGIEALRSNGYCREISVTEVEHKNSGSLGEVELLVNPKCIPSASRHSVMLHSISKEGRENFDIVRNLCERNLVHVLQNILINLHPKDLCTFSQVSQRWNSALKAVTEQEKRKFNFLTDVRVNRENFGEKLVLRSFISSPRKVMQDVANLTVSSSDLKRSRKLSSSSASAVSPSKIRHNLFLDEARKLHHGERLVHCPLCTNPSRVSVAPCTSSSAPQLPGVQLAQCSSPKCNFKFCPLCQCEEHGGRSCRVTRTGSSKIPKSGTVMSKKSKARLRRL